jgi:NAD(P)-dependent dehydrogenase (short-subunit alcohol dehydrogenase family)
MSTVQWRFTDAGRGTVAGLIGEMIQGEKRIMDIRFDGQVAIVTGSARGIGFKVAEILVESGAKVAMFDILADRLADSAKKLQEKGIAKPYVIDLRDVSQIKATVAKVKAEMGEIDVLIQAAAIGPSADAELITEEEWDNCFATNTKGLFFMMQQVVVQSMGPRKKGSIVNFSSIAGLKGMRAPLCSAHYSGSKGAVAAIVRQAAIEWAKYNIRVNGVASGGCKTEMTMSLVGSPEKMKVACELVPLGRLSEPHEVAGPVVFMASSAASMYTGQIMVVDGGGEAMGF